MSRRARSGGPRPIWACSRPGAGNRIAGSERHVLGHGRHGALSRRGAPRAGRDRHGQVHQRRADLSGHQGTSQDVRVEGGQVSLTGLEGQTRRSSPWICGSPPPFRQRSTSWRACPGASSRACPWRRTRTRGQATIRLRLGPAAGRQDQRRSGTLRCPGAARPARGSGARAGPRSERRALEPRGRGLALTASGKARLQTVPLTLQAAARRLQRQGAACDDRRDQRASRADLALDAGRRPAVLPGRCCRYRPDARPGGRRALQGPCGRRSAAHRDQAARAADRQDRRPAGSRRGRHRLSGRRAR